MNFQEDSIYPNPNETIIEEKEKALSVEELERDYIDIEQVSQILGNVSVRTVGRYLDKVSDKHNFVPKSVRIPGRQGQKRLYKKEDIVKIAVMINKDNTIVVKEQVIVGQPNDQQSRMSDKMTDNPPKNDRVMPSSADSAEVAQRTQFSEKVETMANALEAIKDGQKDMQEFRQSFKNFSTNIEALNHNVKAVNDMMTNVVGKIVDQGIDLKEKWLTQREIQIDIEKKRAESMDKMTNELAKKSEATEKVNEQLMKRTESYDELLKTLADNNDTQIGKIIHMTNELAKKSEATEKVNEQLMERTESMDKMTNELAKRSEATEKVNEQLTKRSDSHEELTKKLMVKNTIRIKRIILISILLILVLGGVGGYLIFDLNKRLDTKKQVEVKPLIQEKLTANRTTLLEKQRNDQTGVVKSELTTQEKLTAANTSLLEKKQNDPTSTIKAELTTQKGPGADQTILLEKEQDNQIDIINPNLDKLKNKSEKNNFKKN